VVLRIVNNATGGCGNDLALDDITFRPCGPTIMANISGSLTTSITFCEGKAQSVTFNGNVLAGLTNPALQWQQQLNNGGWQNVPGATGTTLVQDFTGMSAGTYQYRLSAVEAGSLAACRTTSQVLTVTITPAPGIGITSNAPLCEGATLLLSVMGNDQYQWTGVNGFTAAGNTVSIPAILPAQSGFYYVQASNGTSCAARDSVLVTIYPKAALVNAGPDKSILQGETTQLDGSVMDSTISYNWSPTTNMTDINSLTPKVSPPADIDYVLYIRATADSVCGKLSDTVHVFVFQDIYIPNAFTPNRDGINDTWRIPALNAIPVFELSIFNRYGQLIYHIQNNYTPWNGQFNGILQPNGGYVYLLNVNHGKRVFKGIVMLIK